jgi:hypothetical protein
MPSTPNFSFDPGNTNPGTPMAKLSDFWAQNKWDNPYEDYTSEVGGYGKKFLDQGVAANPFGSGGFLGSPETFMSKFNMNYPDINNAGTVGTLGKWSDYLGSGTQNAIQALLPQIAGAGIAGGRGGYGVAGGVDNAGALQKQAIGTAAGGFTQNIQQAMEYMKNLAAYNQAGAGQYLNAYGNMYGNLLGAGQGLMGQKFQGLQAGDRSQADWRDKAYGAYAGDVNNYNTAVQQAPDIAWQRKARNQGWADEQLKRDQAASGRSNLEDSVSRGAGKLGSWAWDAGMAPLWQQEGGVTPGNWAAGGGSGVIKRGNKPGLNASKPSEYQWGLGA